MATNVGCRMLFDVSFIQFVVTLLCQLKHIHISWTWPMHPCLTTFQCVWLCTEDKICTMYDYVWLCSHTCKMGIVISLSEIFVMFLAGGQGSLKLSTLLELPLLTLPSFAPIHLGFPSPSTQPIPLYFLGLPVFKIALKYLVREFLIYNVDLPC